jgi:hypothetical protein
MARCMCNLQIPGPSNPHPFQQSSLGMLGDKLKFRAVCKWHCFQRTSPQLSAPLGLDALVLQDARLSLCWAKHTTKAQLAGRIDRTGCDT